MRRTALTVVTVVIAVALLAGGAARVFGRRGPDRTARQFVAAIHDRDHDRVTRLLTKQARANVADRDDNVSITAGDDCGTAGAEVGSPLVEGETAVVPVKPKEPTCGEPYRLRMRREDGEWRVYGITVAPEGGPEMTIDLEHPEDLAGDILKALFEGPGKRAVSEALKGIGAAFVEAGKGLQRAGDELSRPEAAGETTIQPGRR